MKSILFIISLFLVTTVHAAKITDNDMKLGKPGSTANKTITFDTGDGTSNKKIQMNHSTKELSTTSNSFSVGDGAASNKTFVFNRGANNPFLRWNESSGNIEFSTDGSTSQAFVGTPVGVVMDYFGAAAPSGWLLLSGRTIGNGASGGTERANADTENLFILLCEAMDNTILVIEDSSGTPTTRGVDCETDFAANKRLPLPDARGRALIGQDDMGGTSANRMSTPFDGDVLGQSGGAQTHTLTSGELAAHTHDLSNHYHLGAFNSGGAIGNGRYGSDSASNNTWAEAGGGLATTTAARTSGPSTNTSGSAGSGSAHNNTQPSLVANKIIKL